MIKDFFGAEEKKMRLVVHCFNNVLTLHHKVLFYEQKPGLYQ